jgi:hypothetical protein
MADEDQDVVFVPEPAAPSPEPAATEETIELSQDIEQLQEIKTDLQDLKHLTGSNKAWFLRGILQGAGAIIGSIAMLILLGWLLSILGVIPGASELSDYIRTYMDKVGK